MLLPNGPLAVLGLPPIPAHASVKTTAAAVLGFAIARANDMFNMRINSLAAAAAPPAPAHPLATDDAVRFRWSTAVSGGAAFCACLRVQRVYRGHRGRIGAHIRRNRMTSVPAAAQSAPPESSADRAAATTPATASFALTGATPHSDAASHGGALAAEREQAAASSAHASAVDDGDYSVAHPAGFIPPCVLCEAFDHSTREHPSSSFALTRSPPPALPRCPAPHPRAPAHTRGCFLATRCPFA